LDPPEKRQWLALVSGNEREYNSELVPSVVPRLHAMTVDSEIRPRKLTGVAVGNTA
jgi:hypothetical protein